MPRTEQKTDFSICRYATAAFLFFVLLTAVAAQAQIFEVLHTFSGRGDGENPYAGLTLSQGKYYGTTSGLFAYGSVFKLKNTGSGFELSPMFNFNNPDNDGSDLYSKVTVGPDGALYGTAAEGGGGTCDEGGGCGLVYKLQPPASACRAVMCLWTETVLYRFARTDDGATPYSEVIFDSAGNLYGTTAFGGGGSCDGGLGCGVVYELTPSNGGWTETVLYTFTGGNDGAEPIGGLIFDQAGNLYGTAESGGSGQVGVIFELSPSNGGWAQKVVYNFQLATDGANPDATLMADHSGNLYGVTADGGPNSGGTAFEWSPSGGGTFTVLYSFPVNSEPTGGLVMDVAGNLYGNTALGGANHIGSIFKLHPNGSGWTETDIHTFGGLGDGANPYGGVTMDSEGRLYGTALNGGANLQICANGCGTVWEITP
jgi:uncharacterized repeat protein (TIGR03803 family)